MTPADTDNAVHFVGAEGLVKVCSAMAGEPTVLPRTGNRLRL
jgi:hypothetical protein